MIRPCVLSIAGFDPSAGAGILADVKTLEASGVYGLGACSAITYQNDIFFDGIDWIETERIIHQIDVLSKRFSWKIVKIGLVQNFQALEAIINHLLSRDKKIKIILDPILKASAGFEFHKKPDLDTFTGIIKKIFLLTPNLEEINKLGRDTDAMKNAHYFSGFCNVLLKGGHSKQALSSDILFAGGKQYRYEHPRIEGEGKHGSGCVLSSAIAAELAKGFTLFEACASAKKYTTGFLKSEKGLLGHHPIDIPL